MNSATTPSVKKGDRIEVVYADKNFEVIDPDGLGPGQPAYGFGFRMAEKYIGINNTMLSKKGAANRRRKVA
jgi:hypothetical protein